MIIYGCISFTPFTGIFGNAMAMKGVSFIQLSLIINIVCREKKDKKYKFC